MYKLTVLVIVFILSLPLGIVSADKDSAPPRQDSGGLNLAVLIDESAAALGLPLGDGVVSPEEQAAADAILNEIDAINQWLSEFENTSPEHSVWLESVDQAVGEFNQQIAQLASQPPSDERAQAADDTIAQYMGRLAELESTAPSDPNALILSNAVAPYVSSSEIFGPAESIGADSQPLFDAVAGYVSAEDEALLTPLTEDASVSDEDLLTPLTEDASTEDADLLTPLIDEGDGLSPEDREAAALLEPLVRATNNYIDASNVQHRSIVQRRLNKLFRIFEPVVTLPINGYWRKSTASFNIAGECQAMDAVGDGAGGVGFTPDDPGSPLCGYDVPGSWPFFTWENHLYSYIDGTLSRYGSRSALIYEFKMDYLTLQLNGTVPTTDSVVYRVLPSRDRIVVYGRNAEVGGCTMSGYYQLELVTPDESVCPPIEDVEEEQPEDEEPVVPPPPIDEGPYRVGLLYGDPATCSEATRPPEISEIRLLEQPDDSLVIDYGTGTLLLYRAGPTSYMYMSGNQVQPQVDLTLNLNADGTGGTLSWSLLTTSGEFCNVEHQYFIPGSASDPALAPTEEPNAPTSEPPPVPGAYTVAWTVLTECPEDLLAQMPSFTEATIVEVDNGFEVQGDGQNYLLEELNGQYAYMPSNTDGSGTIFTLVGVEGDTHLFGIYYTYTADGSSCYKSAEFIPN